MMRTETDRAYLAGLLDGEGHIGINNFGGHRVQAIRIAITNTDIETLKELQGVWGGALTTRRVRVPGWKASADLLFAASTAVEILREVEPYLRIKHDQCQLALRFADTVNPASHRTRRLPEGVKQFRETIRQQMLALNKRGATPTS